MSEHETTPDELQDQQDATQDGIANDEGRDADDESGDEEPVEGEMK